MVLLNVLGFFIIGGYMAQSMSISLGNIKTKSDFINGFFPWWGIILLKRKYSNLEK